MALAHRRPMPSTSRKPLLKDHPGGDKQIRVVDMGKYNMGIGVLYRGPTNDKPGDPIPVLHHDYTAETYIITSGSGILTTGGVIENKKPGTGVPNVMNGPSGTGIATAAVPTAAKCRRVISSSFPPGLPTAGAKSQIT